MTLLGLILIILGLILYAMRLAEPIRSMSIFASHAETTNNCQTTVKKQTNKIAMSQLSVGLYLSRWYYGLECLRPQRFSAEQIAA